MPTRRSRRCSPTSSSDPSRRSSPDQDAPASALRGALPLIRRSAPISPTCPTACASCARHAGSRYGSRSSSPRVVGAVAGGGRAARRRAGRRSRRATAGSGARGRPACVAPQTMQGRPATAARWRVGRRQRWLFAAAAWFAAAVCGRAAGRAGEAGCASSVVPSSQVGVDAAATASPSGRRGLVAATFAGMSIRKFAGEDGRSPSSTGSARSRRATC